MLPFLGVGSRHVVALQKSADIVDFEERYRGLRLPVGVEDLSYVNIATFAVLSDVPSDFASVWNAPGQPP